MSTFVAALIEKLIDMEVQVYASNPDAMLGAANFLVNGGWAGARRRAEVNAKRLIAAAKIDEHDLGDEQAAEAVLEHLRKRAVSPPSTPKEPA